jgi:hypothetical protein
MPDASLKTLWRTGDRVAAAWLSRAASLLANIIAYDDWLKVQYNEASIMLRVEPQLDEDDGSIRLDDTSGRMLRLENDEGEPDDGDCYAMKDGAKGWHNALDLVIIGGAMQQEIVTDITWDGSKLQVTKVTAKVLWVSGPTTTTVFEATACPE